MSTQQARCEAYCAEHGYDIIARHNDTHSGSVWRERPGLSALRQLVQSGAVDVVVCYALDRLSRNQTHMAVIIEEVEHHKARLEFVTESFEDSAVGRFIRSSSAFAAEVEREKTAERTIRGRRAAIAAGKPHRGPYPLYGYQWIIDGDSKRMIADPDTAPIVQRIFHDYLAGQTLRGLAQQLYDDGIPSPQGSPKWHPNAVGRLLRHPNYTGHAHGWISRRLSARDPAVPENAIALPEGTVEPLVTQAVWKAVQARMTANRARAHRNTHDPESMLLRGGFARCGVCGLAMLADKNAAQGYRYRCGSGHRLKADRCNISILAATLDAAVWERIVGVLTNPAAAMAEIERESQSPGVAKELARLQRKQRTLQTRQARLASAISMLADPDDVAPLVEQMTGLGDARREVEAALAELAGQQQSGAALQRQLASFSEWRERIHANLPSLSYQERRELLDVFGIQVEVFSRKHKPRYIITGKVDFARFMKPSSSSEYHKQPLLLRWEGQVAAD